MVWAPASRIVRDAPAPPLRQGTTVKSLLRTPSPCQEISNLVSTSSQASHTTSVSTGSPDARYLVTWRLYPRPLKGGRESYSYLSNLYRVLICAHPLPPLFPLFQSSINQPSALLTPPSRLPFLPAVLLISTKALSSLPRIERISRPLRPVPPSRHLNHHHPLSASLWHCSYPQHHGASR